MSVISIVWTFERPAVDESLKVMVLFCACGLLVTIGSVAAGFDSGFGGL
jgi:hypothetical protein